MGRMVRWCLGVYRGVKGCIRVYRAAMGRRDGTCRGVIARGVCLGVELHGCMV